MLSIHNTIVATHSSSDIAERVWTRRRFINVHFTAMAGFCHGKEAPSPLDDRGTPPWKQISYQIM